MVGGGVATGYADCEQAERFFARLLPFWKVFYYDVFFLILMFVYLAGLVFAA